MIPRPLRKPANSDDREIMTEQRAPAPEPAQGLAVGPKELEADQETEVEVAIPEPVALPRKTVAGHMAIKEVVLPPQGANMQTSLWN